MARPPCSVMLLLVTIVAPVVCVIAPLSVERRSIPFPRKVLSDFLNRESSSPGARIDAPPFSSCGAQWQVSLYPLGSSASSAGSMGVFLRLLQPEGAKQECDASFTMQLRVTEECDAAFTLQPGADEADEAASRRGFEFRCGMTFCNAEEAGETVGRCADWGAHVCSSADLLFELRDSPARTLVVDTELSVWALRDCRAGASLRALVAQARRLPLGEVRVGEVVVPLGGRAGGTAAEPSGDAAAEAAGGFVPEPGCDYRIMRLEVDGEEAFDASAAPDAVAYIRPTTRLPNEQRTFENGGWPVRVPLSDLSLSSRLGLRSLPARLSFAASTSSRPVVLALLLATSPLWGGFLLSQLGSAYAIPSRSMEYTLKVGDVVLAEKVSSLLRLPYEAGDLVLFSPPPALERVVAEAGG